MADVNITIGATLDNLNQSINSAKEQINGLKEALATLAAAGGFAALVESITDFAEQTERTAAILGTSTTDIQELGLMAKLTGGSAEQMAMSLQRMQLSAQRGQIATSAQGQALKAMNIDIQSFIRSTPDEQMNKLADATKRLVDQGINPLNALLVIAGRGAAGLMPQLERGRAGMDEWRASMEQTGVVMTTQVTERMAEMGRQLTLLRASLMNLAAAWIAAAPDTGFIKALTAAIGELAKLASVGNTVKLVLLEIADAWAVLSGNVEKDTALQKQIHGVLDETDAAYKKLLEDKKKVETPLNINFGAAKGQSDALKAAESEYRENVALIQNAYNAFRITETEKTRLLLAEVQTRMNAEIKAGESVKVAQAKAAAEIAKIHSDETKKIMDEWKKLADSLASDISSAFDKVLTRQATFGQAMTQMFGKMIEQMIAKVIQLIVEWAILNAISGGAASGGGGPTFAALAGKIFGFASGTPYVSQTGLALIHQGEAIIPAWENPQAGGAGGNITNNVFGGGGGNSVALNIHAMDANSFASWLRGGGGNMLSRYISNAWQQNPSLRPGYSQ